MAAAYNRVFTPSTTYNDWTENPRVFGAIYLGCKIGNDDAKNLITLIERKYPHMEIHQAKPYDAGFKLVFERLR
jgi:hypothetical protein